MLKLSFKTLLKIYLFICIPSFIYSQKNFVKSGDIFGNRVFIENKGQFDNKLPTKSKIDYAYVKGDEKVFFNKSELNYFIEKKQPLTHSQFEAIEHGKKFKEKPSKKAFINVSWLNSNPNVQLIAAEKQSYYHSFGDEKYKSDCYKKLIYKNIYNNIDIEYLFTEEHEAGIKYNIIVHPGGNINEVKIKYSGDVKKTVLKNNSIIIKTSVFDINELSPVSLQGDSKITTNYKLENNIISFEIPNGYNTSKDLTIDPWVIPLNITRNNYGFDVDYDYAGNYYVYGGYSPYKVSKYSQTGSLLWTFDGVIPSINWNSIGDISCVGNFLIDKFSGKTYIGQGFQRTIGTRIIRLNSLGFYDNFTSTPDLNWQELWDMGYDCNTGKIYGLGGTTNSNTSAGILNTITGSITPQNLSGITNTYYQDIVSNTIDSNGTIFFLFASTDTWPLNNKLMQVNPTFNGYNWLNPTNYESFQEGINKSYPNTGLRPYNNSNGFNALASNNDYLYYYDGYNLAAYNKTNGIQLGFGTTIAGLNLKEQGGIAVDECNNVYVGGNGFIHSYKFNGTTFTYNGNIPLNTTSADKYVTDIKLKPDSNELYVTGSGFAGIYTAIYSSSCNNNILSSNVTVNTVSTNNSSATVTVTTTIPNPIITYTWYDANNTVISQTNNSTLLTNTVTNLINGNYTVIAQINAPCGFTSSQNFTIGGNAITTPTFTQVAAICYGDSLANLPTTSNNGITGTWSPAMNNTATTTYTFTPNAGQNANTTTMTIVVNPKVTPTFTITPTTICSGDALSALPTTSNNGVAGTWSPALNNTTTTTYTFTPNAGVCANTTTITITVNPKVTPTFTITPTTICSGDALSALPTTSNNGITGTWSPALNNTATTTYTFTPNTGVCANTTTITITVKPKVTPTFNLQNDLCWGETPQVLPTTSQNGVSGTWSPQVVNNTQSGSYQFTPNTGECAIVPPPFNITVYNDFDFVITQKCIDENFTLQVLPLNNSFDISTTNFVWTNSNNITVGNNSSTFNVTEYLHANSIKPEFPLTFSVEIRLTNGCKKTKSIYLNKVYCSIPKGISPNNDGENDYFDLEFLDVKKLDIFNRYGIKVYSKENYKNEWYGQTDDGTILPDGTYYYVIEFNSKSEPVSGWVYKNK